MTFFQPLCIGFGIDEAERVARAQSGKEFGELIVVKNDGKVCRRANAQVVTAIMAHVFVFNLFDIQQGLFAGWTLVPKSVGSLFLMFCSRINTGLVTSKPTHEASLI